MTGLALLELLLWSTVDCDTLSYWRLVHTKGKSLPQTREFRYQSTASPCTSDICYYCSVFIQHNNSVHLCNVLLFCRKSDGILAHDNALTTPEILKMAFQVICCTVHVECIECYSCLRSVVESKWSEGNVLCCFHTFLMSFYFSFELICFFHPCLLYLYFNSIFLPYYFPFCIPLGFYFFSSFLRPSFIYFSHYS